MMIFVLILGGGMGWMVHCAQVQRDALAAIKRSSHAVRYDWEYTEGRLVQGGKPWEPKWLADLLGVDYFHNVTMVSLSGKLTDADMAWLGKLSRIDTLVIDPSNLSDIGLSHLARLTSLRWLTIELSSRKTDALIVRLMRLKVLDRLRGLNLEGSSITETGQGHLDGLTGLELLGLADTRVTDACLARLLGLTGLQYLFLNGTQVSEAGLV